MSIENKRTIESETNELIRTPIDERFVLTVYELPQKPKKYLKDHLAEHDAPTPLSVRIEDENGSVVKLEQLLSENTQTTRGADFYRGDRDLVEPFLREVLVDTEELADPKNIFGLLHEMGHIVSSETRDHDDEQALDDAWQKVCGERESADDLRLILQDERDAWANAIRLARALKKDYGVDLFALFDNADSFMGWMRASALRSYEDALEEEGVPAYSKEEKFKQWEKLYHELMDENEDFLDIHEAA